MKVAFVSTYDVSTPVLFNGDGHYQSRALKENGIELSFIGPLAMRKAYRYRLRQGCHKYLFHRVHNRTREPEVTKGYSRQIEQQLKSINCDIVFSAISPLGSQPIA